MSVAKKNIEGDKPEDPDEARKKYEVNTTRALDLDFMQYMKQLQESRSLVCDEAEKLLVEAWYDKLLGEKRNSIPNKRRRNIFLTQLILAIKENRISSSEMFSQPPPDNLLIHPLTAFGFSPPIEDSSALKLKQSRQKKEDLKEYTEFSEDNRTYVATKAVSDGSGFMAYVGLSLDDDTTWLDSKGQFWEQKNDTEDIPNMLERCGRNAERDNFYKLNYISGEKSESRGSKCQKFRGTPALHQTY